MAVKAIKKLCDDPELSSKAFADKGDYISFDTSGSSEAFKKFKFNFFCLFTCLSRLSLFTR